VPLRRAEYAGGPRWYAWSSLREEFCLLKTFLWDRSGSRSGPHILREALVPKVAALDPSLEFAERTNQWGRPRQFPAFDFLNSSESRFPRVSNKELPEGVPPSYSAE